MHSVILPVLGANMTSGLIRAWFKREGDRVEIGEPLFEVETDKVNAEVEAEVAGTLHRIVAPPGTRVAVLEVVAVIGEPGEALAAASAPAPPRAAKDSAPLGPSPSLSPAPAAGARPVASPAARRLARERGVSLEWIRGSGAHGEITRADVEASLSVAPPTARGRLDPAFLDRLRRDSGFRQLASESKIELYRRHGAEIGDSVCIESGALILAREVVIGAQTTIGADSTIDCERLELGRLVALGRRTRVHCRTLIAGDALWSKDDVTMGGGGSSEAGAHLRIGAACFIGEGAYLNPCHPVTLGDEVCIGARAMLFTHSHWQSILRGYASLFGPIAVGDHVFVGNGAFVFPGVRIGSGATVMVNSFVALDVPARTLVGGVPAQVIRHVPEPSEEEQIAIFRSRFGELSAMLSELGHRVDRREEGDLVTLDMGGWEVQLAGRHRAEPSSKRRIVLAFTDQTDVPAGTTLFDLRSSRVLGPQDRLSDEVREFCRRRGIRFRPFAWRYRVGHFDAGRFVPHD